MKPRFKDNESYKHYCAKLIVKNWIMINPSLIYEKEVVKIHLEEKHCSFGNIDFVPDLTVYSNRGISALVEIFNTHAIDYDKIDVIDNYFKIHNWTDINVIEINADWVLKQIRGTLPNNLNIDLIIHF